MRRPSACGYPDATNTGVPPGTRLRERSGDITVTAPGTTIADLRLTGTIEVDADHTTIRDSEVIVDGSEACPEHPCGGHAIWIKPGVKGTTIVDDTIRGGAPAGADVVQYAIFSGDPSTRVERVHAYNATEPVNGPVQLGDSLIEANGTIPEEHYEDVYYGGGNGPLLIHHDTLLNPHDQTAAVFASVDFGDQTAITIADSLLAGGDYVIYGGGSGSGGKVIGPVLVTGNRFSRRYFPQGGQYGVAAYFNSAVTTWSHNVWDESLRRVRP